ncbi:MAG: hypothetical protein NTX15_06375 [Candidatus Kapabacteria bacterium]|nr:hypothetical protein [Candidatus Kapabacteria bacterium]
MTNITGGPTNGGRSSGDTLKQNTPILIMNVVRYNPTTTPINNYVGCGIADQPIVLITGTFTPVFPPTSH